ncbi:hypothetical protein V1264_016315 [Littorina saxatilis]|uniref:Uncharacterized protein n=1 Tax=Littorina saxatilis TaxID=31220 RepID=A0AAN9BNV1_9CAEN
MAGRRVSLGHLILMSKTIKVMFVGDFVRHATFPVIARNPIKPFSKSGKVKFIPMKLKNFRKKDPCEYRATRPGAGLNEASAQLCCFHQFGGVLNGGGGRLKWDF